MEITSGRLLLRDVTLDDLAALQALEAEPELHSYRGGGQPGEEETRAFLQRTQDWQRLDPRPVYALAIALRADGSLIGVVSLTITNRELERRSKSQAASRVSGSRAKTCKLLTTAQRRRSNRFLRSPR